MSCRHEYYTVINRALAASTAFKFFLTNFQIEKERKGREGREGKERKGRKGKEREGREGKEGKGRKGREGNAISHRRVR